MSEPIGRSINPPERLPSPSVHWQQRLTIALALAFAIAATLLVSRVLLQLAVELPTIIAQGAALE